MSMNPQRYHIPTHLGVPDKLDLPLFGITISLTMRQALCFLFGWSLAFHLWQRTLGVSSLGMVGMLAHWVGPSLLAFATYVVAVHEIRGHPLEYWALVWLRYLSLPRVFVWRSVSFDEVLTQGEDLDRLAPEEGLSKGDVLENEENEEV